MIEVRGPGVLSGRLDIDRRIELNERLIGFPLYDYQIDYVKVRNDPSIRLYVCVKSRQIGMSDIAIADELVAAIANPAYLSLYFSTKQEKANDAIYRATNMLKRPGEAFYRDLIPPPGRLESLTFRHGARIKASSKAPSDARSITADHAILDEFAHIENQEDLLKAVKPALIRRGDLTMISDPDLPGDMFHAYATDEGLGAVVHTLPWHLCPDLTEERIEAEREECRILGVSFEAAYECQFVSPTGTPFPWDLLAPALVKERVTSGGYVLIGWDPARDRDSSGVIVLGVEGDHKEVIDIIDLTVDLGSDDEAKKYHKQTEAVKDIALKYSARDIYIDAFAQGDPLADFMPGSKRMKMRPNDKRATAAYIKYELGREKLTVAPGLKYGRQLLKDLQTFDPKTGEFPYKAHKGHGDFGSSLFLAWQGVPKRPKRKVKNVSRQIRRRGKAFRRAA